MLSMEYMWDRQRLYSVFQLNMRSSSLPTSSSRRQATDSRRSRSSSLLYMRLTIKHKTCQRFSILSQILRVQILEQRVSGFSNIMLVQTHLSHWDSYFSRRMIPTMLELFVSFNTQIKSMGCCTIHTKDGQEATQRIVTVHIIVLLFCKLNSCTFQHGFKYQNCEATGFAAGLY